jgi:hypothetical protein
MVMSDKIKYFLEALLGRAVSMDDISGIALVGSYGRNEVRTLPKMSPNATA